jgi:ATP-dependent helicase/nuclease subunit B
VAGLSEFCALAHHEAVLQQPLARLSQAAELMDQAKQRTLAGWLDALRQSLHVLAVDIGLQQDDAGAQLLQALETWRQELLQEAGRYRFAEWRRWLAQQLDSQTFLDSGIESRVRFTHLAGTRCRRFDAVLLLGCDADHLPSVPDSGRWFNDAVRSSLELPTRSTHSARQRDDLLALLILNDQVLVTWQKDRDGEPVLLSPYFEMLRDLHLLTHGNDLGERELARLLAAEEEVHAGRLSQAAHPAPPVPPENVPERVSISAYNSLVACPYQFYVRHVLRLNELDEVQKGVEKRDYGELVHEILRRFHERYSRISEHPLRDLEAALSRISEEVFAVLVERDFAARAWLARWLKILPGYIEWQLENENDGWHYDRAESDFDVQLKGVKLRGRIDRLDLREREARVIDYKTQGEQLLRNKLKEPGEDVQLACYAFASTAQDAAFVSLESEKPKFVSPPHDLGQLASRNAERLEELMMRIRSGAGLPANGIDPVCEHCEARGVCRKGEWA